jgi:SAM-dependent methyltransferase
MLEPGLLADLRAAYDRDASRRAITGLEWRSDVLDEWLDGLPDRPRVLELGCGTGQAAAHAADRGAAVTAVDLSPENVAQCRARGVDARVGDMGELDLPDDSFVGAFAINSLIHVPKAHLAAVVTGVRRVLEPAGSFLVVVWGGYDHEGTVQDDWCVPPRFFSFFSDESLRGFSFPGFAVEDIRVLDVRTDDGLHPQVVRLVAA